MKSSQLFGAAVALAAMVFLITFGINFIPDSGLTDKPTQNAGPDGAEAAVLTFPSKVFPAVFRVEWEHSLPGHADYWFENNNNVPVRFGVHRMSCKCSSVQVFHADAAYLKHRSQRFAAGAVGGLPATAHAALNEAAFKARESSLRSAKMEITDEGHEVPANGSGWVRLNWTGDKIGDQDLQASLWMHDKYSQIPATLEAKLTFFRPLRVDQPVVNVGTINPRSLPRNLQIRCWSPTRAHFPLQAEPVGQQSREGTDPFVVGPPQVLTERELRQLRFEHQDGPVAYGYRITVTLLDKAGDRPFDTGPFRRLVRLVSADLDREPTVVPIVGTIETEVKVGSEQNQGRVTIGTFDRNLGSKLGKITLATEDPNIRLELDRSQIPDYLSVAFPEKPEMTDSGRRLWNLEVEALPRKANGSFPRDDDPRYQDSSVYVKVHGATGATRTIRIPVEGNAENR